MPKLRVRDILENQVHIALIIGNGINRFHSDNQQNSWEDLISDLGRRHLRNWNQKMVKGISLPEFYDILELQTESENPSKTIPEEFIGMLKPWHPQDQHFRIVSWAKRSNAPILTTNFDLTLSDAGKCALKRTKDRGFTDFYPWESYYGENHIEDPSKSFGIWHINGMIKYRRSLRLGLAHYMGSVERARTWFHKGNENSLFSGKNTQNWIGKNSWLHVIFNNPLLVFGIGLNESEVFLRWLFIERARYFKMFPDRKKSAWYVDPEDLTNNGKKMFLEGVGFNIVKVNGYEEIYSQGVWE